MRCLNNQMASENTIYGLDRFSPGQALFWIDLQTPENSYPLNRFCIVSNFLRSAARLRR